MSLQSSVNQAMQTVSIASSVSQARKQVIMAQEERAIREKARQEALEKTLNQKQQRLDFQERLAKARIKQINAKTKEILSKVKKEEKGGNS